MVKRFAAECGSFHEYAKVVDNLLLPVERFEPSRAERLLEVGFATRGSLTSYIKFFFFQCF